MVEKKAAAVEKKAAAARKKAAAEKTVATAITKEITEDKGASDATENVETPAESEELENGL